MGDNGKGGAPRRNKNAKTHGLHLVRRAVKARGIDALDKRSVSYRELMVRRGQFISELGGIDAVTKQQEVTIDIIARDCMFLDQVDQWVLAQDSVLHGRGKRKELLPIFRHRDAIVKRIYAGLQLIGLERRQKPVQSLSEYVAGKYGNKPESPEPVVLSELQCLGPGTARTTEPGVEAQP